LFINIEFSFFENFLVAALIVVVVLLVGNCIGVLKGDE